MEVGEVLEHSSSTPTQYTANGGTLAYLSPEPSIRNRAINPRKCKQKRDLEKSCNLMSCYYTAKTQHLLTVIHICRIRELSI